MTQPTTPQAEWNFESTFKWRRIVAEGITTPDLVEVWELNDSRCCCAFTLDRNAPMAQARELAASHNAAYVGGVIAQWSSQPGGNPWADLEASELGAVPVVITE